MRVAPAAPVFAGTGIRRTRRDDARQNSRFPDANAITG